MDSTAHAWRGVNSLTDPAYQIVAYANPMSEACVTSGTSRTNVLKSSDGSTGSAEEKKKFILWSYSSLRGPYI